MYSDTVEVNAPEMSLYAAIGREIRAARESMEISQEDLAARVGLKRTSITNIEAGRQKILVDTLLSLWRALELPPETILAAFAMGSRKSEVVIPKGTSRKATLFVSRALAGNQMANVKTGSRT